MVEWRLVEWRLVELLLLELLDELELLLEEDEQELQQLRISKPLALRCCIGCDLQLIS